MRLGNTSLGRAEDFAEVDVVALLDVRLRVEQGLRQHTAAPVFLCCCSYCMVGIRIPCWFVIRIRLIAPHRPPFTVSAGEHFQIGAW